jgi:hypothetical protein
LLFLRPPAVLGVDDDEEEDDDGVDEVVAAGFDDGGRFRDVSAMMKIIRR